MVDLKGLRGFKRSSTLSPKARTMAESGLTPVRSSGTPAVPTLNLSFTSVDEGATTGRYVGTPYVLNGSGIYTFSELLDPDNKFSVVGGNLVTSAALDYETKTNHSVTLRATNGTDANIDQIFTIQVNNGYEAELSPSTAVVNVNATPGTLVAIIAGREASMGENIASISPDDGRLAITDGQVLVGLSALSVGTIEAILTMTTGRTLALTVTVSALPIFVETTIGTAVSGSASVSAPMPANAIVGDLLMFAMHSSSVTGTPVLTGWTPRNSQNNMFIWTKICDGTESATISPTYTTSAYKRAACLAWRGGDFQDLVGDSFGASGSPGVGGDTTSKSGLLICFYGWTGAAQFDSYTGLQTTLVDGKGTSSTSAKLMISQYNNTIVPGTTPGLAAVMTTNPTAWGAAGIIIG